MILYNSTIGEEFANTCQLNDTVGSQDRESIRRIKVLDDMITLDYIRKRCFIPRFHRLDGNIGKEMERLIVHLTNLHRSSVTIGDYSLYLSEFLHYLDNANVRYLEGIAESHIYARADSKAKREALERAYVVLNPTSKCEWERNKVLRKWLKAHNR